ncbi:type VI secretion system-associated lipoprotein [Herbaspirillum sp. meg3]|uniref:type VI secretion system lipoprotein TssJ n=1 Tax=Herbaspirillum sp. meg3 TaxID=2025949 RepID=UPI000B995BC9|nr:type VI secretion system lipoprotein TssJ [Herbaspirillum sp. meg3]ASU41159.1 type VI secretion system-associated lipoprotein [Herbaspirillum sp. meg3]
MLLRCVVALSLAMLLAGCSITQTVSDAASNAYRTLFPKKQDTLHIGIVTDNTANLDGTGKPLSVVVRVYQLRRREAFNAASYEALQNQDKAALAYDALSADSQTVLPNTGTRLSVPLSEETQYLGVAAFFRKQDDGNTWRLVVDRKTLLSKPNLMLSISEYTIRIQDQTGR